MKKVISIALFGDGTRKDGSGTDYHRYLTTFVLAHVHLFPAAEDWSLVVHIDDTTLASPYGATLRRLESDGLVRVAAMGSAGLTKAMLWRMGPVFAADADYVFCRDIDCIPMPRDRQVCDLFISSNCAAHTVHDSPSHAGVMGGLCGFQSAAFKNAARMYSLGELYSFAKKSEAEWAEHGTDQIVLNRLIDRQSGPTLLEHRYAGWHAGPGTHPARPRGEYRCKAWSQPVPDLGRSRLPIEVQKEADLLANHLGAAGYDIERARAFWEEHGDAAVVDAVRRSEAT